jgi:RNA polymerase sigma-70 factor (ECF subfamily)
MKGNKDPEPEGKENSDPLDHSSSPVPGPEDSVILAELRECIKQVLEKLERNQANLIIMRDFQNMSYDEIANSLALSLSAIKMRIHRARLAFQEFFMQLCGAEYLRFSVPSSYSFKDKGKKG